MPTLVFVRSSFLFTVQQLKLFIVVSVFALLPVEYILGSCETYLQITCTMPCTNKTRLQANMRFPPGFYST